MHNIIKNCMNTMNDKEETEQYSDPSAENQIQISESNGNSEINPRNVGSHSNEEDLCLILEDSYEEPIPSPEQPRQENSGQYLRPELDSDSSSDGSLLQNPGEGEWLMAQVDTSDEEMDAEYDSNLEDDGEYFMPEGMQNDDDVICISLDSDSDSNYEDRDNIDEENDQDFHSHDSRSNDPDTPVENEPQIETEDPDSHASMDAEVQGTPETDQKELEQESNTEHINIETTAASEFINAELEALSEEDQLNIGEIQVSNQPYNVSSVVSESEDDINQDYDERDSLSGSDSPYNMLHSEEGQISDNEVSESHSEREDAESDEVCVILDDSEDESIDDPPETAPYDYSDEEADFNPVYDSDDSYDIPDDQMSGSSEVGTRSQHDENTHDTGSIPEKDTEQNIESMVESLNHGECHVEPTGSSISGQDGSTSDKPIENIGEPDAKDNIPAFEAKEHCTDTLDSSGSRSEGGTNNECNVEKCTAIDVPKTPDSDTVTVTALEQHVGDIITDQGKCSEQLLDDPVSSVTDDIDFKNSKDIDPDKGTDSVEESITQDSPTTSQIDMAVVSESTVLHEMNQEQASIEAPVCEEDSSNPKESGTTVSQDLVSLAEDFQPQETDQELEMEVDHEERNDKKESGKRKFCEENVDNITSERPCKKKRKPQMLRSYFCPLREHRTWCPWIRNSQITELVSHLTDLENQSHASLEDRKTPGWKKLVDLLLSNNSPQKSIMIKFAKTTLPQDSLRSIRQIIGQWTSDKDTVMT